MCTYFFLNILLSTKQYELLLPMLGSIPHSKLIENFESYFLDSIDIGSDLLLELCNSHVIDSTQMRAIEFESTSTERNKQLLNIISNSSPKSFNLFLTALAQTDRSNVLEQMQLMHSKTETPTTVDGDEVDTAIERQSVEMSTDMKHSCSNTSEVVSLPSDQEARYEKLQAFRDENVAVMELIHSKSNTLNTGIVYETQDAASERVEKKVKTELRNKSVCMPMLTNIDNGRTSTSGIYSIPSEQEARELLHSSKDEETTEIDYTLENKKHFLLQLRRIKSFSSLTAEVIKNQESLPDDIQHQLFLKMKATCRELPVGMRSLSRHLSCLLGFHSKNANCAYNQEVVFTYHMGIFH